MGSGADADAAAAAAADVGDAGRDTDVHPPAQHTLSAGNRPPTPTSAVSIAELTPSAGAAAAPPATPAQTTSPPQQQPPVSDGQGAAGRGGADDSPSKRNSALDLTGAAIIKPAPGEGARLAPEHENIDDPTHQSATIATITRGHLLLDARGFAGREAVL